MNIKTILSTLLLSSLVAAPVWARENWPVPDDAVKAREAEWNAYEQQVISNDAPVIAEWAKKVEARGFVLVPITMVVAKAKSS